MSELVVMIDERARLLTAVLAVSEWPDREQAQLTHAVHPHAKQTRQFLAPFAGHTAVLLTNQLLAAGISLATLFSATLRASWPDFVPQEALPEDVPASWLPELADFARQTAVADRFWPQHDALWQEALADLRDIFSPHLLPSFLARAGGQPLRQTIYVLPNLLYPYLSSVLAETSAALYLLPPLPKAVGEAPPWPYREGPDVTLTEVAAQLLTYTLQDTLAKAEPGQRQLLLHAAIALFLEEASGQADAMAYLVRIKRQFKLPTLPLVVEQLREELTAGRPLAGI